mgnify:CR=1 FL=1
MKVRELMRALFVPALAISALFAALTFLSAFAQSAEAPEWVRFLLERLELREERTIGTWFQSLLFVAAGAGWYLIGRSPETGLKHASRGYLRFCAIVMLFLSADEILAIHEYVGYRLEVDAGLGRNTPLYGMGFTWVLIYIPLALIALVFLTLVYRRLIRHLPNCGPRRCARRMLTLAWALFIFVSGAELLEAAIWYEGFKAYLLPCFEETMELALLMTIWRLNLVIAEARGL